MNDMQCGVCRKTCKRLSASVAGAVLGHEGDRAWKCRMCWAEIRLERQIEQAISYLRRRDEFLKKGVLRATPIFLTDRDLRDVEEWLKETPFA